QGATDKTYVVQTSTKIVERCLLMTTDPGDLVLDPTCGSGTTAYVAEQWGRRWVTIDTSRVALALARTRLMAARFPYYPLHRGASAPARPAGGANRPCVRGSGPRGGPGSDARRVPPAPPRPRLMAARFPYYRLHRAGDLRQGFVCRRVPHVTLSSITSNPDLE